MNGPIADRYGRKIDMMLAVAIFTVGSAVQAGAVNIEMLFVGKTPLKLNENITDIAQVEQSPVWQ